MMSNDSEKAQIAEEYRIWKKNSPFLYDLVMTHALEWASLTVQWLPGVETTPDGRDSIHKLILGTHTSDNIQNHLILADIKLPLPEAEIVAKKFNDDAADISGFGATLEKIKVNKKIAIDAEINKARYMPQHPHIIAAKAASASTYIYNTNNLDEDCDTDEKPHLTCAGHNQEGYGLAWSTMNTGHLLSGSDDKLVCLWDVSSNTSTTSSQKNLKYENNKNINPLRKMTAHADVVEDVAWSHKTAHLFGTVGDDKQILLWDSRESGETKVTHKVTDAHDGDVNCISFNPFNENLFVTGGGDNVVNLWDLRKLPNKVHRFEGHQSGVQVTSWSPFSEYILGSSGKDRRCILWDMARIGEEQDPEDEEDGVPELLFSHGGHTDIVSDFSWNQCSDEEFCIASVSEDNMLQVWKVASGLFVDEDEDDLDDLDLEDGDDLEDDDDDDDDATDKKRQKTEL